MKDYLVQVTFIHTITVNVEAENESDAIEFAQYKVSDIPYDEMDSDIDTSIVVSPNQNASKLMQSIYY